MRILRGQNVISAIRNGVSNRRQNSLSKYTGSGTYSRILSSREGTKSSSISSYFSNSLTTDDKSDIKNAMYKDITYTATKGLTSSAAKLAQTGETSLFGQAEKTGNTEELVSKASDFVKNYNNMISCMSNLNLSENGSNLLYFSNCAEKEAASLKEIGITVLKGGKLTVNQNTLKKSSVEALKKAFNGTSSFGGKVLEKSTKLSNAYTSNSNTSSSLKSSLNQYYDFSV